MVRIFQFIAGIALLLVLEVLRVYFIMPFPGSQRREAVDIAYFLHTNMFWLRTIGLLIIFFPVIHYYWMGSRLSKWLVTLSLISYVYIFMVTNYQMRADKIFYQPKMKTFSRLSGNAVKGEQLVLGVSMNGAAKAYPIEIIGYHHQVRDTIGTEPVMITYCTVCRAGRVYSPVVNNKQEQFRLVGMDRFNAMFEDETTGSWWRQVTGEAVAGPLKGTFLSEIPSRQLSLNAWLDQYPDSEILQPDTNYREQYAHLEKFDEGTLKQSLLRRDSLSWKEKSWVVGIQIGAHTRAYDWNELVNRRVINDTLARNPIVIALANDSTSFGVWERGAMEFSLDPETNMLRDAATGSRWNFNGRCIEGALEGTQLMPIQAYQEFWHSWRTFRSKSTRYISPENEPGEKASVPTSDSR
jgi:hypothetical protein